MGMHFSGIKAQMSENFYDVASQSRKIISNCKRGGETLIAQTGKMGHRVIKFVQDAIGLIHRNKSVGAAILVGSNILFFEIAFRIVILADKLFERHVGKDENIGHQWLLTRNISLLAIGGTVIAGLNVALYKGLRLPFSPLMAAAISVGSCGIYILLRLIWVS